MAIESEEDLKSSIFLITTMKVMWKDPFSGLKDEINGSLG